jgi:hypothetical protein
MTVKLTRRRLAPLALALCSVAPAAHAADNVTLRQAMARARELREEAQRAGDQPYGAPSSGATRR